MSSDFEQRVDETSCLLPIKETEGNDIYAEFVGGGKYNKKETNINIKYIVGNSN